MNDLKTHTFWKLLQVSSILIGAFGLFALGNFDTNIRGNGIPNKPQSARARAQGYEEELFKTLWSIRNLSKNTQMIYSKNLKRISKNSDLNEPESVERYVFGLDVINKYRNSLFDAYSHYCKTNDIEWQRPVLKTEVYPVKVPTEENIDKIIACATPKYATVFHISKHGRARADGQAVAW